MANTSTSTPSVVTAQVLAPAPAEHGRVHQTEQLSGSQFASLLAAIRSSEERLDRKLATFKSDVQQAQEEAATKAAKCVRHDKPYTYKKKAHEEQAQFNAQVQGTIQEAQDAFAAVESSPALHRAQEALERGARLLLERQKLIKIADRSANGWGVVAEYTADELADDSDDEKRLEKAEKTAERKAGLRKRKRVQPAPRQPPRYPPQLQQQQPGPSGVRRAGPPLGLLAQRAVGPCFACGEMGHLRAYCPKMPAQERKWYPFPMFVHECVSPGSRVSVLGEVECGHVSSVGNTTAESAVLEVVDMPPDCVTTVSSLTSPSQVVGDGEEILPENLSLGWEMEADEMDLGSDCVVVKGRLKEHVPFWKDTLRASATIISTIESGYVLPLKSEPTTYSCRNDQSANKNAEFVESSILELCTRGGVVEVHDKPYICSPLSVVESSSGKKRLVVNLRHLNRFLWKQKFKYEDLTVAMSLFEKGDYMFSFDLKSGYHHVDITQEHWKYLGFSWQSCFYVFTVLPFGLSSACYIFTKLLRPLVRYWRSQGLRIIVYLDDGVCAVEGECNALEASLHVRSTLSKAGFVVNAAKSVWKPTQRLQWLGFVIDLSKGHIEVPTERLETVVCKLQCICQLSVVPAKLLASVVGSIISMSLAMGPVSRFMTRGMYALLESRVSWWESLEISPDARQELEFWRACMSDYNCQPIWHSPSAVRVVYSDASDTGYGGYVIEHGACVAYGQWTEQEAQQSSTWRELTAVLRVLMAVAAKLSNFRVRWFTDNQNVARILVVGSKKPLLQAVALTIFSLTVQSQIRLEPEWIPRELNERADYLSHIIDYDDWQLNPSVFSELEDCWGPHSVDRFASFHNCQVPRFNSRCWNPGSEAVDAFTVDWSGENNWWCPPIGLIPRVIRHAQACRAEGSMVVPLWPSAVFWPLVCPVNTGFFASFIRDVRELPQVDSLFLPGLSGSILFNGESPNTKVLALRCNVSGDSGGGLVPCVSADTI